MEARRRFYLREMPLAALLLAAVTVLFFGVELISGANLLENVGNDPTFCLLFYPFFTRLQSSLSSGFFPLWWNNTGLGFPILGVQYLGAAFPLYWLFLPFDLLKTADVLIMGRVWLMLCAAYLFARRSVYLTPYSSALAAATLGFSGYILDRLPMWEMSVVFMIPLFAHVLGRMVERPRLGAVLAAGILGALALMSGHPPAAFYMFFIGGAWLLFRRLTRPGAGLGWIVCAAASVGIAVLLSSIQQVPGIEVMATFLSHHRLNAGSDGYQARGIFSIAMPWLAGNQKSNPLALLTMQYLGFVPVVLTVFGMTRLKRLGKDGLFFAGFLMILLGMAYNLPFFRLIKFLPGFNRLANHISAMPGIEFSMGILSGMVLDLVLKDSGLRAAFRRFLLAAWPVLLLVSAYGWWLIGFLEGNPVIRPFLPEIPVLREQWFKQVLLAAGLLAGMALIVRLSAKMRLKNSLAAAGMAALAFTGLWADHFGWNVRNPGYFEQVRKSQAVAALEKEVGASVENSLGRVTSDFIPLYLTWLPDFSDIRVISTFWPARYIYLFCRINGLDIQRSKEDYREFIKRMQKVLYLPFDPDKMDTPVGRLMDIRYGIASPESAPVALPAIYSGKDGVVYKNPSTLPRLFVAEGSRTFDKALDVLDFMMTEPDGWEKTALFAARDYPGGRRPWESPDAGQGTAVNSRIELKYYLDQKTMFNVTADRPSLVIMTDLYMPGWKAEVNGAPSPILKADYLMRAIQVPEGGGEVRIWYQPVSFAAGLWVTITSFLFFCLAALYYRFVSRRKAAGNQ